MPLFRYNASAALLANVPLLGAPTGGTPGGQVPLLSPGTTLGSYDEGSVPAAAKWVDSVNGSNSNTGSLASPWLTTEYAISAAASGTSIYHRGVAGGNETNARWIKGTGKNQSQLNAQKLAIAVSRNGIRLLNAPGEAVGWDGSQVVDPASWTQDGTSGYWYRTYTPLNWSPQYTVDYFGTSTYATAISTDDWTPLDGKDPGGNPAQDIYWQDVDPTGVFSAAAARPERCFRDGVQLRQVAKFANLQPGRFFLDAKTNRHWIADNPSGHVVEMTVIQKLFNFLGYDQAVLGMGIRRYANSQPLGGIIQSHRARFDFSFNWCKDNAMAVWSGVGDNTGYTSYDSRIKGNTFWNTKNLHARAVQCDRLLIEDNDFINGNDSIFNPAPSSGHFKFVKVQDTMIRYNRFRNVEFSDAPGTVGHGKGVWFDVQCLRPVVHSNEFYNMGQKDVTLEMTYDSVVFNNLMVGSGTEAISLVDAAGNPWISNNVIMNTGRLRAAPETRVILTFYANGAIHTVRDSRRITPPSYAYDQRYNTTQGTGNGTTLEPVPTLEQFPTMPGGINPSKLTILSNVVQGANVKALVYDEEQVTGTGATSFRNLTMQQDYNLFSLSSSMTAPGSYNGNAIENETFEYDDLSAGGVTPTTTALLRSQTGFESNGQLLAAGSTPVNSSGNLNDSSQLGNAYPLPARIASLIGVVTGTTRLGRITPKRS